MINNKGLSPTLSPNKTKVLILGTFPSRKSLELQQYYANPMNRFWKMIFYCLDEKMPDTYKEKVAVLSKYGICLWDLLKTCDRDGSLDENIRNAIPNDIFKYKDAIIIVNGGNFKNKYKSYGYDKSILDFVKQFPSTSSANTHYPDKKLFKYWKENIIKYL